MSGTRPTLCKPTAEFAFQKPKKLLARSDASVFYSGLFLWALQCHCVKGVVSVHESKRAHLQPHYSSEAICILLVPLAPLPSMGSRVLWTSLSALLCS